MANKDVSYNDMRKGGNKLLVLGLILVLVIGAVLVGVYEFSRTHFGRTTIQGVDCSWLSMENAKERLENSIGKTEVTFTIEDKSYVTTYEELGVEVSSEKLKQLLKNQNFFSKNEFSLENGVSVSKEKVKDFLSSITELQEENVVNPQNAYVRFDGNNFVIEKEVIGNKIDYDKVYSTVEEDITDVSENLNIDLTSAMELPQVFSTDEALINECDRLNNILSTVVTIKLMDGSTYTIDRDVMKTWVVQDGESFTFNMQENVTKFVDELSKAAENVTTVQIEGTGVGYVTMPAFEEHIPKVMKEETINFIMDKLESGESYTGKPIYDEDPVTENLTSYVEIDITRQRVFMYVDGKCIVDTPTVTGNIGAGYYTPTGVFYLNNKVYNTVLRGTNSDGSKYASPVLYWMPFYRGYGIHDANWRDKFGGEIYKHSGSHGCVNLPTNAAKTIYDNITYDMPIFIYQS